MSAIRKSERRKRKSRPYIITSLFFMLDYERAPDAEAKEDSARGG